MNKIAFDRLFSMSSFEGLRLIRRELITNPGLSVEELIPILVRLEPGAKALDFEAALYLNEIVDANIANDGIDFYKGCISTLIIVETPVWAKLITLGRKRFIQKLYSEEYRDVKSLFRQAGLLADTLTTFDIAWWDHVSGRVRLESDRIKLEQARRAEKLSLEFERMRCDGLAGQLDSLSF